MKQEKELRSFEQWICWREVERDGKKTKIPIDAKTKKPAKSDSPTTWADFQTAKNLSDQDGYGLGFVFSEKDPYIGIDLDSCINENGSILKWAKEIVEALDSYTEISPSRTGLHVILKAKKNGGKCRTGNIEVYDAKRFFTMTGDVLWEQNTIQERQKEFDKFYQSIFPTKKPTRKPTQETKPNELTDNEIIEKATNAKNGQKFQMLWSGDMSGYKSHSEADMALCSILAFWTGNDYNRIDRLFRQSKLYRGKWEREDYRSWTINAAIGGESYQQKKVSFVKDEYKPTEEEKDITSPEKSKLPSMADECWRTGFYSYREALKESTEACDEYHFGMFLTVAGTIAGRNAIIKFGTGIYPNFYACFVGDTGESRKSTAAKFGTKILTSIDPLVKITRHLSTPEGLIHFMRNDELHDEFGRPLSHRVIAIHNELASLMKKAQQTHSSGLIARLTDAYDCPPTIDNPTAVNPITVAQPFLSMVGLSTGSWLEDSLTERDIMGGFANRFLYFVGNPKEPIPFPNEPENAKWNLAQASLLDLYELTSNEQVEITVDSQAIDLWKTFYFDWHDRIWENETVKALIQRIPDNIIKIAGVYALLERKSQISWKMLDAAIKVGQYCAESIQYIFRLYGSNEYAIVEAKIIEALKELGGECRRSKLHHSLSGRVSAIILDRHLEALVRSERIQLWDDTTISRNGREYKKQMVTLLKN